jgi:pre-mRNA-processing factor 6
LKFERQHGTEEQREAVRVKCVVADPHHSPVWQSVAKDVKNARKSTREILEKVADLL